MSLTFYATTILSISLRNLEGKVSRLIVSILISTKISLSEFRNVFDNLQYSKLYPYNFVIQSVSFHCLFSILGEALSYTANEGMMRIQYKCLVSIYVFS
jgi:hypothetical protein